MKKKSQILTSSKAFSKISAQPGKVALKTAVAFPDVITMLARIL
jgi:hypothetical protein